MCQRTSFCALGIALVALAVLTVSAVEGGPPPSAPTCLHTPFHRITATSEIGEIIGATDPLDWGCANGQGSAVGRSVRTSGAGAVPPPTPPSGVCFLPAYPNPATTAARLRLSLGQSTHVLLVVYGQTWHNGPREVYPVRTLFDTQLQAGEHTVLWDGRDASGVRVPAGIYRAVMEAGEDVLCGDIEIR